MASPMFTDLKGFKVGDKIKFWSGAVFGVPVHGQVTAIGRKYLAVDAWFGLAEWKTKVHPHNVLGLIVENEPWWMSEGDRAIEEELLSREEEL